jgi:lysyl-tRNA synthetase class I
VPPAAARLSAEQRAFLGAVADLLQQRPEWDQIDLHYAIEAKRESMGLSPRDGVNALHLAIYNKLAGQQVAWFLGKAKRDFIVPRLKAVAAGEAPAKAEAEVES